MKKAIKGAVTVLLASAAVVAMAGCAPGSSSGGSSSPQPTAVATGVGTAPVSLTIAYCDQHPVEDLINGFVKLHPNVTVNKQYEDCNTFSSDITNRMTSSNPPDITEYVDASIQTLVPGGDVLNLDPYVTAYGWNSKFPASELAMLQLSSNGKTHGTGSQYGIPGGASFVGLYYNKSLLAKAGIAAPPTTITDFEADLAAAKKANILPIELGAQDDGGIHLWGSLATNLMGVSKSQDWVDGKSGATINTPGALQATTLVQQWAQEGYINASANGTSENDSWTSFVGGSALFTVNGSWAESSVPQAQNNNIGFADFPTQSASDPHTGMGFVAGFAVSSRTKHAAAATAFLDYLSTANSAAISVGLGLLPVDVATAPSPAPGVASELSAGYDAALKDNGVVVFYDHATPTMANTLTQGLQGVIAGKTAPQAFIDSVQADWTKNQG